MELKPGITAITSVRTLWHPERLRRAGESISGVVDQWIVVIDGSKYDEVAKIVLEDCDFKGNLGVVVLDLFNENAGNAVSRNTAMKFVQTEYVYALDADDYVDTEAFKKFAQNTMESKFAWGASQSCYVDENDEIISCTEDIREWDVLGYIPQAGFLDFYEDLGFYPIICSGGTIISTELVRKVGGWDEYLKDMSEDISLIAAISEQELGYWSSEHILRHQIPSEHGSKINAEQRAHEIFIVDWIFGRARPGYEIREELQERLRKRYLY